MTEELQLLYAATNEIKDLRNQVLRNKADAYDRMSALIGFLPRMSQGFGEDIAWKIDQRIRVLETPPDSDVRND